MLPWWQRRATKKGGTQCYLKQLKCVWVLLLWHEGGASAVGVAHDEHLLKVEDDHVLGKLGHVD